MKSQIAPFKYPRVIEFVETLPLTATGKIQRGALRAFEHGRAEARSPTDPPRRDHR